MAATSKRCQRSDLLQGAMQAEISLNSLSWFYWSEIVMFQGLIFLHQKNIPCLLKVENLGPFTQLKVVPELSYLGKDVGAANELLVQRCQTCGDGRAKT